MLSISSLTANGSPEIKSSICNTKHTMNFNANPKINFVLSLATTRRSSGEKKNNSQEADTVPIETLFKHFVISIELIFELIITN